MDTLINATAEAPLHPFFPLDVLLPDYAANTMDARALVGTFAAGTVAIWTVTNLVIQATRPTMSKGDRAATMWFVLCGCIHLFFEGYYVVNFTTISGKLHLFAQLWKEYALSDSRYMTQDGFMVIMEGITAFLWGPMSFICAWFIIKQHPLRFPLQLIVSVGQIYGDILYYGICYFNEIIHDIVYCRPERFYFYMYYVLCNAFWILFPGMLVWQSIKQTGRAFAKVQAAEKTKKGL
ncbi:hypothetical protein F66182_4547 [Fusarium sp. NRRL 66182]|nr:hypothetical protein F66182_4547 [Fusarium sp. NRRL 66182]